MADNELLVTIKRLFQKDAPIDVAAAAKFIGLGVWEDDSLPESIAGKIFRDSKNGGVQDYSIVVRAKDPFVRKRFTIAHELAHYILHRNKFNSELIEDALYRSGLSSRVEAQANGLAADLLMPRHLLAKYKDKSVTDLAALFQVSEQAMRIRVGQN